MTLLGERNWYLPRWLRWLPRPPAELPEPAATAGALLSPRRPSTPGASAPGVA